MTRVGSKTMSIRRMTLPKGTSPLVREIYKLIIDDPDHTLSSVSKAAGFGQGAIANWRLNHVPSIVNFEAALNVLGYTLAIKKVGGARTTDRLYDYGTHECMDRTYLVMELLSYVSEHPQVKENSEWAELADQAHTALFKLYQSIGQRS